MRHIGLTKTHLQPLLTATAMNLVWVVNGLNDEPHAKPRPSRFAALNPAV